jgi:phytoene synthase
MLVDGVEMDFSRSRYADFDELRAYCTLVASVVGRMCVRIFGFSDPVALQRADDLGMALQLTNILRDVREDAVDMKRVYLPQDELRRFGIPETALADGDIYPGWGDLINYSVARARTYFATGYEVLAYIPRRPAACVQTMAGIYEELLKKIERDPALPLRARAALSKTEKLRVVVRSWLSSA